MKIFFKKIVTFYITSSIHVGVATLCLTLLSYTIANIPYNNYMCGMVFFGTIFSYNFIKYYTLLSKNIFTSTDYRSIYLLSAFSLLISIFCFFFLNIKTQLVSIIFLVLTVLYVFPLRFINRGLRNFSGIKIYIVSFCWAGVTLLLPLLNYDFDLNLDIAIKFVQRFLLTLILILIFEIKDLEVDNPNLKTVPQTIGINKTKLLIVILCLPFFILEFLKDTYYQNQWIVSIILIAVIVLFTAFVTPKRHKYYTLFWVESVPILWLFLTLLFNHIIKT